MVLVGVHPVLTHVPPSSARSIKATFHPRSAKAYERGFAAWPAPMTIASNFMPAPQRMTVKCTRIFLVCRLLAQGNPPQKLSHNLARCKLESTHGQGMGKQSCGRASAGTRVERRPQK